MVKAGVPFRAAMMMAAALAALTAQHQGNTAALKVRNVRRYRVSLRGRP